MIKSFSLVKSKEKKCWSVYLLKCADETLYCGITTDVNRRIKEHNETARGAKYTRGRRPVSLVGFVKVNSRSNALKLEHKIKSFDRKSKIKYILDN